MWHRLAFMVQFPPTVVTCDYIVLDYTPAVEKISFQTQSDTCRLCSVTFQGRGTYILRCYNSLRKVRGQGCPTCGHEGCGIPPVTKTTLGSLIGGLLCGMMFCADGTLPYEVLVLSISVTGRHDTAEGMSQATNVFRFPVSMYVV